ncbi:MAG: RNA-binding protein [Salinivirgaceae bacterium]|nr:RNA-binding protein [Salinivirgaceae bacterium]MDD4745695.1 RNA-binding protein [Salinivirgaceae bacterium]MDY0279659.1 RNA-binding protein [Salinivirgaceae bacterium]
MKIFVANLSPRTTGEDLNRAFCIYGEVNSAKVIFDKVTGNSKRYGFIEMPNDDEAAKAIEALNESNLDENCIVAKISIPTGDSEPKASKSMNFDVKFDRDIM